MRDDSVLVTVCLVAKFVSGKVLWFVVRESEDSKWSLPRTIAKRGESSVRAGVRLMAEQGAMDIKVLEEVGRSGGAAKIKGKLVTQRVLFYLVMFKEGSKEALGFAETDWVDYAKASRKLDAKQERAMLKEAHKMIKTLDKERFEF